MMLIPCYLAPSAIEGLGVFTSEAIAKGDPVWRFDDRFDRMIPKADISDAAEHVRLFIERYGYDMPGWPDHLALDADEGRFMNHTEAPNLDFSAPDVGYALRDIAVGEELTCDYREFTVGEVVLQGARHLVSIASHANGAEIAA